MSKLIKTAVPIALGAMLPGVGTAVGSALGGGMAGTIGGALAQGAVGSLGSGLLSGSGSRALFGGGPEQIGLGTEDILGYAKPVSVTGPGGMFSMTPDGQITYGLSPEQQALAGQYETTLADLGMTAEQLRGLGGTFMGDYGTYMAALEGVPAEEAAIAARLRARAGEQAAAYGAYDPAQAARDYYETYVAPDLLKSQERERLALENRLLSQGMLGATGGALRAEAQATAQEASQRQARGEAFTQAQTLADLMRARELEDIQAAAGLTGDIFTRGYNLGGLGEQAYRGAGALTSNQLTGLGGLSSLYSAPMTAAELGINTGLETGQLAAQFQPVMTQPSAGFLGTSLSNLATGLGNQAISGMLGQTSTPTLREQAADISSSYVPGLVRPGYGLPVQDWQGLGRGVA